MPETSDTDSWNRYHYREWTPHEPMKIAGVRPEEPSELGGNREGDPEDQWGEGKIGHWPMARRWDWDGTPLKLYHEGRCSCKERQWNQRVGMSGLERRRLKSWGRAQQSAVDQWGLGVKPVKQLVVHQPWKEGAEAGREAVGQIRGNQGRRQPTTLR